MKILKLKLSPLKLKLLAIFLLLSSPGFSATASGDFDWDALKLYTIFGFFVLVMMLTLVTLGYMLYVLNMILLKKGIKFKTESVGVNKWLFQKFVTGKTVMEVPEGVEVHAHDGIIELDNPMPPWLKYLFIGTIFFAGVYLLDYLVLETGLNQEQEYQAELVEAESQMEQRQLTQDNSVNEQNVIAVADEALISEGKSTFDTNCKACHGGSGEGGVGPNLTDPYWIHGGSISDVFKIIKNGVPEKGMIAWQAKLSPVQIQNVASYILTLAGTNPANGKQPEGTLVSN